MHPLSFSCNIIYAYSFYNKVAIFFSLFLLVRDLFALYQALITLLITIRICISFFNSACNYFAFIKHL